MHRPAEGLVARKQWPNSYTLTGEIKSTLVQGCQNRPVRLHMLAGRYDNPIPRSPLYPPVSDYEFGD